MTVTKYIVPPTREEIMATVPTIQKVWDDEPSRTMGQMKTLVRRLYGSYWYKKVMPLLKDPKA